MSEPQREPRPPRAESAPVEIGPENLPLRCPLPDAPAWNQHPRVYIAIEEARPAADGCRHARCPYCGTEYVLRAP